MTDLKTAELARARGERGVALEQKGFKTAVGCHVKRGLFGDAVERKMAVACPHVSHVVVVSEMGELEWQAVERRADQA